MFQVWNSQKKHAVCFFKSKLRLRLRCRLCVQLQDFSAAIQAASEAGNPFGVPFMIYIYMMMFLFVSQMSQILIEHANFLKIVNKQGTKPNNYLVALIPHRAFERDTYCPVLEYGAWRRRLCSCVWRSEGIHRRTKSWRMLGHIIYRHIVWTFLN